MSKISDAIKQLWQSTKLTQVEIAIRLGCSPSYVQKTVHGIDRPAQNSKEDDIKPPVPQKEITPKDVIIAYFEYPEMLPRRLAYILQVSPEFVIKVCHEHRLPFRGELYSEDMVPK